MKDMMNRFVASGFARLAVCALLSLAGAWSAWGIEYAPVSPAYAKWQKERKLLVNHEEGESDTNRKRLLSASAEDDATPTYAFGGMFSPIDRSYLLMNRNGRMRYGLGGGATSLPETYDQRTRGNVTPVRNQGQYGTCWAHGTLAAIESQLLLNGRGSSDFSEKHMANKHGWDLDAFEEGGYVEMAIAYLVGWRGPIAESEDKYPSDYYHNNKRPVPSSPNGTVLGHVQNIIGIPPLPTPSETSVKDTDEIKNAVIEYGGVRAGYMHVSKAYTDDGKNFYWNGDTALYTYDKDGKLQDGGHVVMIVGWNDKYSKK